MKIVTDRRIPGIAEGIMNLSADLGVPVDIKACEGSDINADAVRGADALFVRTRTRVDASLLAGSRVRLVGTATIGTDHIDAEWCRSHGISIVNAPGCNAPAVMQYVAASLAMAGFDPARDTLGVVGKGNIGSLVVGLYRRAGARVLVCDPPRKEAGLSDEDYLPLREVLEQCDAVTFHVPFTTAGPHPTLHLLSGPQPENLRIVVNASRGGVVDPAAVDTSRRFIIDTWPFEDAPAEWPEAARADLIAKAFIATPHIAGYSFEGKERATAAMLAALRAFMLGETPLAIPACQGASYALADAVASFSPLSLSEALKADPSAFEALRGAHLRHEPSPIIIEQ